jgi:hypothetical protein
MNVTRDYLAECTRRLNLSGWEKSKWIEFAESMLEIGYSVELYEALATVSKYLTVYNMGKSFKVRFSNHRPKHRGQMEDCDFFVGKPPIGERGPYPKMEDAIKATVSALGECPLSAIKEVGA